ncbi:MAG: glycerol-3-phosphate 1-O-acyltransferase PlsY [Candidatus Binatia bacterium]
MEAVLLILFAYLSGSIPVGYLLGRRSGVDVRQAGSGNIGATNVARVAGRTQGAFTLLGDAAKGLIPVVLSSYLGFSLEVSVLAGAAALLGHLFPLFLRFQGGKGVATALGVLIWLAPAGTLVLAGIFLATALSKRVVSLSSLIAAGAAPIVLWSLAYRPPVVALSVFFAIMIALRHRDNIRRLLAGVEPKFGSR